MAIKAISFKALVRPEKVELTTKSGIIIQTDEGMEMRAQVLGTIIELGEDFADAYNPKTPKWGLKPGDKVFYAKYAGKWIKAPNSEEELLIINDEDICGVYIEEETKDGSNVVETKEA